MKKILHISKYYYPFRGGTEQIAQDCVNSLKDDYQQIVICFNHKEGNKRTYIDDILVHYCHCEMKLFSQSISLSYGKQLKLVLDRFRPDVVVFHYPNPFVAQYLLHLLPAKTKFVIFWHLDIVKQKLLGKFFIYQNYKLLDRADLIIAGSPNYAKGSPYISKAMDKCVVVPDCINVERLKITDKVIEFARKIKAENSGKIICLAVGRHTEYKGFKYLIRAGRLLDDRFVIFITGKGEETENLKKEAEGDKKVRFLGVVEDNILKAYLSAMDIFCFPSVTRNEAFGVALAEAMYYGKPTVTFTIPGSGVNYVSLGGITGIEVPNRDVRAYAEALMKLANDVELREKYGAAGRKRVEDNFLNTQFAQNITKCIGLLWS